MKQWIKNWLLRKYMNVVVVRDIITTTPKGAVKLNGIAVTANEVKQLQAEIKALENFRIWGIMTDSLRYVAYDKIFNRSVNFDDVIAGKMMLYNLGVQSDIIKTIKKS